MHRVVHGANLLIVALGGVVPDASAGPETQRVGVGVSKGLFCGDALSNHSQSCHKPLPAQHGPHKCSHAHEPVRGKHPSATKRQTGMRESQRWTTVTLPCTLPPHPNSHPKKAKVIFPRGGWMSNTYDPRM